MTWRTVHPADPEGRALPVDPPPIDGYDPADERDHLPWTCSGPGPLREEFLTGDGRRDVRTIEPCPDCAGGPHRRPPRVVAIEDRAVAS